MILKFDYCPVCGHCQNIFGNDRKLKCPNCFSEVEFAESINSQQYYLDKSMERYNDYFHIHELFIEEEVQHNPLFDPEKAKLTTVEDNQREIILRNISTSTNTPKCPICSSTRIRKISSLKRATHACAFGLFSKTARSQFECENCHYKF